MLRLFKKSLQLGLKAKMPEEETLKEVVHERSFGKKNQNIYTTLPTKFRRFLDKHFDVDSWTWEGKGEDGADLDMWRFEHKNVKKAERAKIRLMSLGERAVHRAKKEKRLRDLAQLDAGGLEGFYGKTGGGGRMGLRGGGGAGAAGKSVDNSQTRSGRSRSPRRSRR